MGRDHGARIDHRVAERLRLSRAARASIQTAGRPKAGSRVGVPGSGPSTRPGLIASYMPGNASPSPTATPFSVMR